MGQVAEDGADVLFLKEFWSQDSEEGALCCRL